MYQHLGIAWLLTACLLPVSQITRQCRVYQDSNEVYCTQTLQDLYLSLGAYVTVPTDNDRTAISDPPVSKSKGSPMMRPADLTSVRQSREKSKLHAPYTPLTQETSSGHLSELSTFKSDYPLHNPIWLEIIPKF